MEDTIYAQLNTGQWGVKGKNLKEGAVIGVLCGDEPFTETIDRIIWKGKDGTQLATIKSKAGCNARWDGKLPRNMGTRSSRVAAKMCEQCGIPFTYDECQEKGGRWKDAYCGC